MSHFTVIVVSDTGAEDEISRLLQPFHEYECTGVEDKYVVQVDVLAAMREKYETETALLVIQRPDGSKFYGFEDEEYAAEIQPFLEYADSKRREVLKLPDDWASLREEPVKDYKTLTEFITDYYAIETILTPGDAHTPDIGAYIRVDAQGHVVEACEYTNPNSHWDWWIVGGRWTGYFKKRPSALTGETGKPGMMTEPPQQGFADSIRKRDIDFDAMYDEKEREAREWYARVQALSNTAGVPLNWSTWDEIVPCHRKDPDDPGSVDFQAAREEYNGQGNLKALRDAAASQKPVIWLDEPDSLLLGPDKYAAQQRSKAVASYAFLNADGWHQKGNMGWWGISLGEREDWPERFDQLLADVPDDKFLTVVDCHI